MNSRSFTLASPYIENVTWLLFIIKTANIFLLLLLDVETQSVAVTTKLLGEETNEALKRLGDLLWIQRFS